MVQQRRAERQWPGCFSQVAANGKFRRSIDTGKSPRSERGRPTAHPNDAHKSQSNLDRCEVAYSIVLEKRSSVAFLQPGKLDQESKTFKRKRERLRKERRENARAERDQRLQKASGRVDWDTRSQNSWLRSGDDRPSLSPDILAARSARPLSHTLRMLRLCRVGTRFCSFVLRSNSGRSALRKRVSMLSIIVLPPICTWM